MLLFDTKCMYKKIPDFGDFLRISKEVLGFKSQEHNVSFFKQSYSRCSLYFGTAAIGANNNVLQSLRKTKFLFSYAFPLVRSSMQAFE